MLLYGFHSVTARLRQSPASVKTLYLDRDRDDPRSRDLQKLAKTHGLVPTRIEAGDTARHLPKEIPAILALGRAHGCDYVLLDCDGPTEAVLPTFPW